MKKVLVMASGFGSNFEAIVEYFKNKDVCIELLSDKNNAYVLKRAKSLGIKSYIIPFNETSNFFLKHKFNLVVLAGYMRILPKEVLNLAEFINIHPSLLPKYKGLNAIKCAFMSGEKVSGITIHYVNEEVDCGEIIFQAECKIGPDMTLEDFEEQIHFLEHTHLPRVIEELIK